MGRCLKPIGGEFWFQDELIKAELANFENTKAIFLDGGQSSLYYIYKGLDIEEDEIILMPAYLCPSMLIGLDELDIKCDFYDINKDLTIDVNSIETIVKARKVKAILFVDYFGFYHNTESIEYLKKLKQSNIILIEDAVQMLWFDKSDSFIGNYVFNSYRKFLPIDGSVLIGDKLNVSIDDKPSNYVNFVKKARDLKSSFINTGIGSENEFLVAYFHAEEEYYKDITPRKMIVYNKEFLNNCDLNFINYRRTNNFKTLEKGLEQVKELKVLFCSKDIKNTVLGFVVFAKDRDNLRNFLRQHNIFCPVHWNLGGQSWVKEKENSMFISNNIITLPIDQRYDEADMNRMVVLIKEFYSKN